MKNAINWFEIPVTDMPRAIDFYQNMLGVELKQQVMDGIEMAIFPYDDKNVSGCLVKADFMQPGDRGSLVYLNVEGFMDQAIERATAEGSSLYYRQFRIDRIQQYRTLDLPFTADEKQTLEYYLLNICERD